MKNLKKGLALVLSFAMILSTFTISFAQETKYGTEAQALMDLGLVAGKDGDLALNDGLTKQEAIVLMASIFDWDCAEDDEIAEAPFEDVAKWAYAEVAYAKENGIVSGESDTVLGKAFNRKHLSILFLRQLGYEIGFDTAETVEAALKAGIIDFAEATDIEGTILRDDAFGMAYNTLKATPKNGTQTVIEQLIEANKVDAVVAENVGLYEKPAPEALAIEDVEATNLKEAVVTFNKPVDKGAAEEKDNYDFAPARKIVKAELQEDGITVKLTLDKDQIFRNNKDYTLKVDNIKDVNEVLAEDMEYEFTVSDNELPKVTSAVFTGPKSMEISFSEPVNKLKTGKIADCIEVTKDDKNGSKISVKKPNQDEDFKDNVMTLNFSRKLSDGTDYTINITNVEDYNGLTNYPYRETLTYVKSTELPTAEVTAIDEEMAQVDFSKPVKGLTKEHFYHTYSGYTAYGIFDSLENADEGTPQIKDNDYYSTVYVKFSKMDDDEKKHHAMQPGTVEFTIKSKDGNKQIEDAWGNEYPGETYFIEVSADRTNPEFVSYEVIDKKTVELKFSKEMNEKELEEEDNYTVFDEDGKEKDRQVKTATSKDGGKIVRLTLRDEWEDKTIAIQIEGLKDNTLHGNLLGVIREDITFNDKENGGINSAYYEDDTLYVMYDEDMNDTVVDEKNYQYYVKTIPYLENGKIDKDHITKSSVDEFEADPEFYEGGTIVSFDLTKADKKIFTDVKAALKYKNAAGNEITVAEYNELDTQHQGAYKVSEEQKVVLIIGRVEDEEGNLIDSLYTEVTVDAKSDSAPVINAGEVKLVALDEITFEFNKKIESVDESYYHVYCEDNVNSLTKTQLDNKTDYVESASADGKKVTLMLSHKLGRGDAANLRIIYDGNDEDAINDLGEAAAKFDTKDGITIKDEVKPSVVAIDEEEEDFAAFYDNTTSTTYKQVYVVFNEQLEENVIGKYNVTVDGDTFDVKNVSLIDFSGTNNGKKCIVVIDVDNDDHDKLTSDLEVVFERVVDETNAQKAENVKVKTIDNFSIKEGTDTNLSDILTGELSIYGSTSSVKLDYTNRNPYIAD